MMILKNTSSSYGFISITFHWLIAAGVIILLVMGFLLGSFKDEEVNNFLYMVHKSTGLLVLVLMLLRIAWYFSNVRTRVDHLPLWQRQATRISHDLLYLLLIVMPLSGWIMSVASDHTPLFFNLFSVPLPLEKSKPVAEAAKQTHNIVAWVLMVIVSIHILAALKHYFYNKDQVMQRMLPFLRKD